MSDKHKPAPLPVPEVAPQPAGDTTVPTPDQVAKLFGVEVTKPLSASAVQQLRKPFPGYAAQLDDSSELLGKEPRLAYLIDFGPLDLLSAHAHQKTLLAKESVAQSVYEAIYYQRLEADDRGIGMLQKLGRKIQALAEDDPAILLRWKGLLDYLASFRPGPRKPAAADPMATAAKASV